MRGLVLGVLACLAGCAQVSPRSMLELARFDPVEGDLSAVTVAVDVSDGLRVARDGAVMDLRAAAPDGRAVMERFVLDQRQMPGPTGARWLYGIASEDAARLADAQRRIRALKAADPETSGQLSVTAAPCTLGPIGAGTVDVLLQLGPDRPFVPVVPRVDLAAQGVPVPACEDG